MSACVVLVTAPSGAVARQLAHALVSERLAACGNIVPGMHSVYRWEGRVEEAEEVLLLLKTQQARVAELTARIAELHPYDVPEAIAVPVMGGLDSYLDWVFASTMQAEEKQ